MPVSSHRHGWSLMPLLSVASLVMLAGGIAGALWAFGGAGTTRFLSADAAGKVYAAVVVGTSSEADLGRLGLDSAHGARRLSALGVQEYFMPQTTTQFDRLAPAVRACFGGLDRCTALVVPVRARDGGPFAAHAAALHAGALGGYIAFLMHDGTVAYKEVVQN